VETITRRDSVDAAHAARAALRVLASLPRKQRRYLALKVASHSCREICALTGASYTSVNKHLASARARNPNGYVDGCGQAVATTGLVTVCLPPARQEFLSFFLPTCPVVAPVTDRSHGGEVSRTPKSGILSRGRKRYGPPPPLRRLLCGRSDHLLARRRRDCFC
jgi:DNA-binding CsgD family transcriptional regulator